MNKRIEDYNKVLPINELYRCVQSEGSFGRPTIAVRTTGCTLIDVGLVMGGGWCDSWYTSIILKKVFTFNDIIRYL